MFRNAVDCLAVQAYFECVYKVAFITSVKEKNKRLSVEELLALPDSSLVRVISYDRQLIFSNVNAEKKSIHSVRFHSISSKPGVTWRKGRQKCLGKHEICLEK